MKEQIRLIIEKLKLKDEKWHLEKKEKQKKLTNLNYRKKNSTNDV